MQRRYKILGLMLTAVMLLTVLSGNVPVFAKSKKPGQNKTVTLKETVKVLFLGECKGLTKDGVPADYLSELNVRTAIEGFNKKDYSITLKTKNADVATVSSKKDRIYANGIGQTKVVIKVKSKKDKTVVLKKSISIVVKKSADNAGFVVTGITDGQTVYEGDELTVSMPGDYTDVRTVICEDEGITILPQPDGKSFRLIFEEAGDYYLIAGAYLSPEYDGFTAYREFDITVKNKKATVRQTESDKLVFEGGPVDEELEAGDIMIESDENGIKMFYCYAAKAEVNDDCAQITLFKCLESRKTYYLEYDGLTFEFVSGGSGKEEVASFEITETSVRAGEDKQLTFRYYNSEGMDITASVEEELDSCIELEIVDPEQQYDAYITVHKLYVLEEGKKIEIKAKLDLGIIGDDTENRILYSTQTITSLPKKGETFTGKTWYSLKKEDGKYLKWGEKSVNSVPLGDSVVFQALFEMDDGRYRTLSEIGITEIIVGDMRVAMIGSEAASGGYNIVLNSEGSSSIICFMGEKSVATFEINVVPKRKASELRTELSKQYLNTDDYADDQIILKADVYDQYGDLFKVDSISVEQPESCIKQVGAVKFNEAAPGRFIIYGWECPKSTEQKAVRATVSAEGFSEEILFYICDIAYDDRCTDYEYKLEIDGNIVIDTATGLTGEEPQSTFVTVKISQNGYYVSEGTGLFFSGLPSVRNGAEYYGVEPGECLYGITVGYREERTDNPVFCEEGNCIVPAYTELEFVPYVWGEKLLPGFYEITVYMIKTKEEMSDIRECDRVTLIVVDSDPEIEVTQIKQSCTVRETDWKSAVTKYFDFRYGGEDISKYVTKVDCVEASNGNVFIRSVDFMIPDPYFGLFTKTALVERLVTKQ